MNRMKFATGLGLSLLLGASFARAEEKLEIKEHTLLMDHGDGHLMDMDGGMVMGQNKDKLPGGCSKIAKDVEVTVRAGHKYSRKFPGTMFAFDQQELRFEPCTRLTVHFINEDKVRHQWMMHGLPKYIYDKGMFHLEVTGPAKISGTLILPKEDKTYLVHCDIAQHMEKGMKAQLVVGKGSGIFPSIPGVTDLAIPDNYGPTVTSAATPTAAPAPAVVQQPPAEQPAAPSTRFSGSTIIGLLLGLFGTPYAIRTYRRQFAGMSNKDVLRYVGNVLKRLLDTLLVFSDWVWQQIKRQARSRFGH